MPTRLLPILAVAAAVLAAPSTASATHDEHTPHGITTHGAAIVTAPHDLARFTFGASDRRRTSLAAQRAASRRISRVIAAVRRAGVAPADVRTGVIRLSRIERSSRRGRARLVGYRATQSVRVTVRDLARAGAVVAVAVEAGANDVSGPDFGISNRSEVYRQALRAAVRDARAKAQVLADEAGVTLGRAIGIVESGNIEATLDADSGAGAGGGDEAAPRAPVRPGVERIDAFVTVTFETS